ncbi:hypothetical protein PSAC2689_200054 [Paraburkholderia sacchari]
MAVDGSILVVRICGRCMNSDAFFSFSAIGVRFSQVTGAFANRWRSHPQMVSGPNNRQTLFALN